MLEHIIAFLVGSAQTAGNRVPLGFLGLGALGALGRGLFLAAAGFGGLRKRHRERKHCRHG